MNSFFRLYSSPILLAAVLAASCSQVPAQSLEQQWQQPAPAATSVIHQLQEAFVSVAAKIKPSVVTIYVERRPDPAVASVYPPRQKGTEEPASPAFPSEKNDALSSLGSGIVLDHQGHILTNYHVVKDAMVIRVSSAQDAANSDPLAATLIGYDAESDLAVLEIPPSPAYQPVEFGDSEAVQIGEWVLAVGAPFDQVQSVTAGVISAKGRHLKKDGHLSLQRYLQTDASINPGNSGGPLVNMQGQVIGINTAILSPSRYSVGIGFAVPSSTITRLLPLLLEGKHVERGFLGISYLPLDPDVAAAFDVPGGMQIGALAEKQGEPYGPAFEAGLRSGDIITSINGQLVSTSDLFRRYIASLTPGTTIQLQVMRPLKQSMQHRTFEITLSDRNQDEPKPAAPLAQPALNLPKLGMQIENTRQLTAAQRTLLGQSTGILGKTDNSVIITHVRPGTAADKAQLQQGQIIEEINIIRPSVTGDMSMGMWQTVGNKNQLMLELVKLPGKTKVLFKVRDNQGILLYKIVSTATLE